MSLTPDHPITSSPITRHSSPAFDVAIIGGGVAGSALAITLARAGRSVVLIEREARFRDRVRGDALFPWGAVEAGRLGIADVLPLSGARPLPVWQPYTDGEPEAPYRWADDVPTGDVVWGVNHPELQETLFCRARDLGVETMRPAKAIAVDRQGNGPLSLTIDTAGATREVRTRLIVGADGKNSGVRRWIGADTIRDPLHHVIGGCLVAGIDLARDAAHLARLHGGVTLVFRHANDNARLYLVCQPELAETIRGPRAAERFIAACAEGFPAGSLDHAHAVGPAAFFPGIDMFADRIAGDGIVLIGDAAGANDPSQGMGLSLAFRDVRELSELLDHAEDWQWGIEEFARRRPRWYEPLRVYAAWQGPLMTDIGPEADAARERAERAKERDPGLWGYRQINALGPDGLPVSEEARRHVLGEDLVPGVVEEQLATR
jgi:2-polyprenyl-6-methoxyphenol hydroxylase-like FAD-dependent oxidoreductase